MDAIELDGGALAAPNDARAHAAADEAVVECNSHDAGEDGDADDAATAVVVAVVDVEVADTQSWA